MHRLKCLLVAVGVLFSVGCRKDDDDNDKKVEKSASNKPPLSQWWSENIDSVYSVVIEDKSKGIRVLDQINFLIPGRQDATHSTRTDVSNESNFKRIELLDSDITISLKVLTQLSGKQIGTASSKCDEITPYKESIFIHSGSDIMVLIPERDATDKCSWYYVIENKAYDAAVARLTSITTNKDRTDITKGSIVK